MVQLNALVATFAAILSMASASPVSARQDDTLYPEPITIGRLSIPHGYVLYAYTPTKTTLQQACSDSPSRTMVQSVQTGRPDRPLCNNPFSLDGYSGLEFLCADGTGPAASQVTAIATNGTQTHLCTNVPLTVYPLYCGGGASISQQYICQ
ncbi:hypothetical protein B0H63DRAFT_473365 [Podospora didyma]|uniref:AA1-like domain-containing protein n=1 Tax=Podospora didyma TaxID=330526 RepID=A0AAE0U033_9PEZI|nr:hypothetical protein B0H63DRAFT_473365 [Podospora didyma]